MNEIVLPIDKYYLNSFMEQKINKIPIYAVKMKHTHANKLENYIILHTIGYIYEVKPTNYITLIIILHLITTL